MRIFELKVKIKEVESADIMMEESRINDAEDEALYPKDGQNQRILFQRKGTPPCGRNVPKIILIVITVVTILIFGMNLDVYSRQKESTQAPPRITLAPRDQKVVDNGIVSFFCKATGNPAPDIYWQKNGIQIGLNGHRLWVVDMPHGSVLRIEPVRANRDNNDFECVADNGIGMPAIAMASLEVYPEGIMPEGYPEIVENPTLKAVEKGKNTVMVCTATGNPDPEIMWLKDYISVNLQNPRLELLSTGALQITSSQESDEGRYECIAENSVGVAYSYSAHLYVRVRQIPPSFSILPETPIDVMPGGDVNLTCEAVGSPIPYVKWRLGALELTEEESIPIGQNVLQLTNVQETGNYTCVAASDLGNIEAVVEVHVEDPLRITLAPRDQKAFDNGIVSFFCKAAGNPAPDIYWRRNGKQISLNENHFLVVDMPHGSVLRIEPVRANRDNDNFECVADNGIEMPAIAMASLEVYPEGTMPQGYPEIVENPTLKAVEKGRNTVMVCSATGNPDPEIMWLKDFIPVNLQDPRLKLLSSGALQITSSQESDEGKYECIAENSAGVAYSYSANLYVRVRRGPPRFSILPETPIEVIPGGGVNLTCVAVGSPMPYVKWQLGALKLTEEGKIPVGRNVLQLTNIQESGDYTCVAASDLGNIEAVVEVHVKEQRRFKNRSLLERIFT